MNIEKVGPAMPDGFFICFFAFLGRCGCSGSGVRFVIICSC